MPFRCPETRQLLAAIAEVAPGPRVAVSMEGSRSYGIGLTRALAAAGLLVIECEQPSRKQRRGKGRASPIDAHLAVLAALPRIMYSNRLGVDGESRQSDSDWPIRDLRKRGPVASWPEAVMKPPHEIT